MGWIKDKYNSTKDAVVGAGGDAIDAVADAGEGVVEAVGEAGDDAVEYVKEDLVGDGLLAGGTVISEALHMAGGVVDIPGNVVESVSGSNVVTDAFYVPGDLIEDVNDLVPGFLDGDEDSADAPEPTQLTAPTQIPEGVMTTAAAVIGAVEVPTESEGDEEEMPMMLQAEPADLSTGAMVAAATVIGAVEVPTESEGDEEEMLQPLIAEGTDLGDGILAGAVTATEAIIATPTEQEGDEEEMLQPREVEPEPEVSAGGVVDKVQDPVVEVVEDPPERVGGFADKISAGADSSLDIVEEVAVPLVEPTAERVGEVLERTGEAVTDAPIAEEADVQLVEIGGFGSGAAETEPALEQARIEAASAEDGFDDPADEGVSELFSDSAVAVDQPVDDSVNDGFLEGVGESVSDFIEEAKDSVGDAVDTVSDFVEDLFDGE